jgi:hypothetical protein
MSGQRNLVVLTVGQPLRSVPMRDIGRTMAQIHALMHSRSERWGDRRHPFGGALDISTSLKQLQGQGLAKVPHVTGDRRDGKDQP